MKNRERIQGSSGFTLVEVLVALAVFAGLMLTLFVAFNAFTASNQMIIQRQPGSLGPGLDIMASDLEQVFTRQVPQFQKTDLGDDSAQTQFQFLAEQDQVEGQSVSILSFPSLSVIQFSPPGDKPAGITRLTYYVRANGEQLDIHRADRPAFLFNGDSQDTECSDPVLFRDILEFDLVFFDREGNAHKSWNSLDEAVNFALPSQVGIRITLNRNGGEKKIEAWVAIPVKREVVK